MEHIVIEQMKRSDLPQVVELQRTILPFEVDEERARARYDQLMEREDHVILAAKEGAQVLGTATVICCQALSGNFLVVEDVVVKPGLTGKGIGGLLLEAVDRFAAQQDCAYAILVSSGFRTDAHRFYYNHGFNEDVRGFRKVYHP